MPKLIARKANGKKRYVIDKILYNTNWFNEFLLEEHRSCYNFSRFIKAAGHSTKTRQLGIINLGGCNDKWDDECNSTLRKTLMERPNIFSLNMAANEVGRSKSNVVHKFVQLLLEINKDTGMAYIYSTGLILGWFGDIGDTEMLKDIYSAMRKYVQILFIYF